MSEADAKKAPEEPMTFADFLATYPPGHSEPVPVKNFGRWPGEHEVRSDTPLMFIEYPEIRLWCSSLDCNGMRTFKLTHKPRKELFEGSGIFEILHYECKDCESTHKGIVFELDLKDRKGFAYKVGEMPPFRPQVPNQVLRMFHDQVQLFRNGQSCENQGLGIGAFAYYRQLVEMAKDHLIDEIIKAAQKEKGTEELIKELEAAKKENQFTNAIDSIKKALPDSLNIEGHNPLTLLHQALSKGLHAQTDKECLALAKNIRVVLTELADRISKLKEDHSELKQAVSSLISAPRS